MWMSMALSEYISVASCGEIQKIPCEEMAEGCVGIVMVFRTKKQALKRSKDVLRVEFAINASNRCA